MAQRLERPPVAWAVLGAAMAAYAALALWITRGTTLFVDEANLFIADRGLRPSALLAPLNGHLILLQRALFAIDFKLFGADFVALRIVEVVGVIGVVGLVYELARRRIGNAAALAPAVLLLFLGSVWELNFVVSGIGNVYAALAGLAALLCLERHDRRADLAACALLLLAVASFTTGVAFACGAFVLVALQPGARRRLWVALVPLAAWAAWLVWVRLDWVPDHGEIQTLRLFNVLLIPNYIANEAASLAGVLTGLNYDFAPRSFLPFFSTESAFGPVLATAAVAALAWRVRRGPRPPVLWALIATLLAFWAALALGFGTGRNPETVRYAYGGAIIVLLLAAEAARGVRLSPGGLVALFAITVLALGANLARLRDASRFYRTFATSLRAELTGLEIAGDRVAPAFKRSTPTSGLTTVPTARYLAAVRRSGSPAYSQSELLRQPEARRHDADTVLVQALRLGLTPARAPVAGCLRVPRSEAAPLSFRVPGGGVRLTATSSGRLALRRFAAVATVPAGVLPAGRPVLLQIPPDRSSRPWRLSVSPGTGSLSVCPAR